MTTDANMGVGKHDRWIPLALFVLGVAVLLPSIWSETSVTVYDEYVHTFRAPMEMQERGEWLTPWEDGQPRLRKPPLLYWAILANYHLLGVNLAAARIWGVLAGAAMAVCACLFARECGKSDGLLAGLLALGSIGVAVEARQAMLDLPLALFAALAVLYFLRWLRRQSPPNLLLSSLFLGLSFMTKGPVGFFFFVTGALTACWWLDGWTVLRRHVGWQGVGLVVLAAICVPWPLAMHQLWGDRLVSIVGDEMAARHLGQWHASAPFSALCGALGLVAPWTPVVVGAMVAHFRAGNEARSRENGWLIAWFLASVVPFFFMKSFERYMLAVVPIQAALAAGWLEQGPLNRTKLILLRVSILILAITGLLFCGFVWWFRLGPIWAWAGLALTGCVVWSAFRFTHPRLAAGSANLLLALVLGGVYLRLGISYLPPDLDGVFRGQIVRTFNGSQPAMISMRAGYSVQEFKPAQFRERAAASQGNEMVFVEEFQLAAFQEALQQHQLRAQERARFKTLYSRKAWLRFARAGAGWPEWRAAFRARSLESLKVEILCFEVSPGGAA